VLPALAVPLRWRIRSADWRAAQPVCWLVTPPRSPTPAVSRCSASPRCSLPGSTPGARAFRLSGAIGFIFSLLVLIVLSFERIMGTWCAATSNVCIGASQSVL
jgi:hypothetical protein